MDDTFLSLPPREPLLEVVVAIFIVEAATEQVDVNELLRDSVLRHVLIKQIVDRLVELFVADAAQVHPNCPF